MSAVPQQHARRRAAVVNETAGSVLESLKAAGLAFVELIRRLRRDPLWIKRFAMALACLAATGLLG
ncbi:MAG: hypothetical protein EBX68_11590, partial [Betaproteobacteria bacterium]|nr:hypothetical protein [Betaproteobacteria bacterium]